MNFGLEFFRRGLQRTRNERNRIAIGIDVIGKDSDTKLPIRTGQNRVRYRRWRLVQGSRRRDTNTNSRRSLLTLTVFNDVGEDIGSNGVRGRSVLQPIDAELNGALGRGLLDSDKSHRVTVGIDTVQRHGNSRCFTADCPRSQCLRLRLSIRSVLLQNLESNR